MKRLCVLYTVHCCYMLHASICSHIETLQQLCFSCLSDPYRTKYREEEKKCKQKTRVHYTYWVFKTVWMIQKDKEAKTEQNTHI